LTITTLFLYVFFSGCNFDPYKDSAEQGDTATYNISGTVTDILNKGIPRITVSLYDSISSMNSPRQATTDTNGTYTLNTLFIRRDSLQIIFFDNDPNNGDYDTLIKTIRFSDLYFDHHFPITQNAQLFK
jgi:putative lipoprotein (rSAM/lipoprotein system)